MFEDGRVMPDDAAGHRRTALGEDSCFTTKNGPRSPRKYFANQCAFARGNTMRHGHPSQPAPSKKPYRATRRLYPILP
jgi:hypothetical protein